MKELLRNLVKLQTLEFGQAKATNPGATITELRGAIPPQILEHYDRLMARGKKGIVAVLNQVCAGCHMRQPIGVIATLLHGDDLQLCDSCGRYLYLPETVAAPAPAVEPPKPVKRTARRKAALHPA